MSAVGPADEAAKASGAVVAVLAEDINREHALASECAQSAIQHAIRCGQMLLAKKAELRHGEFMGWVAANCNFKYSTAARYVKAAKQSSMGIELSSLSDVFPSTGKTSVGPSFLEIALTHMDEWKVLHRRIAALERKLEDAIRDGDLVALSDICRNDRTEIESDIAILRLRTDTHLGSAFKNGLTLADAIAATPEALAAALGVDPDLSLKHWLTRAAPE